MQQSLLAMDSIALFIDNYMLIGILIIVTVLKLYLTCLKNVYVQKQNANVNNVLCTAIATCFKSKRLI